MLEYPPIWDQREPLVAFYGPMCSGKTTAATNLFKYYKKLSLADPLKQIARDLYGVSGKTNEERKILQELADDLKKWDRDVFTKKFLWQMVSMRYGGATGPIVTDDVRYVHEAEDLKRYGFVIVRVYVPEEIRQARIKEKYPDTDPARFEHPTERDWKNIRPDYTILGEGEEGILSLRGVLEQNGRLE